MLDLALRAWYGGRPAPLEERLEEIDRITADAVNDLARESFASEWAGVWRDAA
jgi:predicted Zn-dependent peptidase